MRRVLVIGCGGAGKSTFSARLASKTGLELIHLDSLYWSPGWVALPKVQWINRIEALLARDGWIMDGNYGGTLEQRLQACDAVIFLDLPRRICMARVFKRWLQFRGRSRPAMSAGCPERLSLQFLLWIWRYPKRHRPAVLDQLARLRSDQQALVLDSNSAIEKFLGSLA